MFKFSTYCSQSTSYNQEHNSSSTYVYSAFSTTEQQKFGFFVRPVSDRRRILLFQVEGRGVGDTHITGRHFGGDTHITSDMCVGIHMSRGYTYHCHTAIKFNGSPAVQRNSRLTISHVLVSHISASFKAFLHASCLCLSRHLPATGNT